MNVRILSDLHIDHPNQANLDAVEEGHQDLVICAGDVCNDFRLGFEWLRDKFPDTPIVFVPGNHEYYGCESIEKQNELMDKASHEFEIDVLQSKIEFCNGFAVIGLTLWSDFMLYGRDMKAMSMILSEKWINDFRYIGSGRQHPYGDRITAADLVDINEIQKHNLKAMLTATVPSETIIITHFAPHRKSVALQYAGDPLTPYFVNDLHEFMGSAKLFIHGHTHIPFDYEVNGTRVIANPSGYKDETKGLFKPNLVVKI